MAKVIATDKGYFGGQIREPGESFTVPDDLWRDPERRPKWARLDPRSVFGGKGDHDGDGAVGGGLPASPAGGSDDVGGAALVVPADWQNLHHTKRRAIAKEITGKAVASTDDADRIIAAYVDSTKPEPFGDAPAPQTVGNGIQQALGGTVPDWVAPTDGAPQAVTD